MGVRCSGCSAFSSSGCVECLGNRYEASLLRIEPFDDLGKAVGSGPTDGLEFWNFSYWMDVYVQFNGAQKRTRILRRKLLLHICFIRPMCPQVYFAYVRDASKKAP